MTRGQNTAALNAASRSRSEARFLEAIKAPTLGDAIASYGKSPRSFWTVAKRLGVKAEVEGLYPEDIARIEKDRVERARLNFKKARAAQLEQEREETANLIEDAEWLAITNETQEGAVRRLGFESWNSLYARLANNGRSDITDRITRNTDGRGKVHQGAIGGTGRRP